MLSEKKSNIKKIITKFIFLDARYPFQYIKMNKHNPTIVFNTSVRKERYMPIVEKFKRENIPFIKFPSAQSTKIRSIFKNVNDFYRCDNIFKEFM